MKEHLLLIGPYECGHFVDKNISQSELTKFMYSFKNTVQNYPFKNTEYSKRVKKIWLEFIDKHFEGDKIVKYPEVWKN